MVAAEFQEHFGEHAYDAEGNYIGGVDDEVSADVDEAWALYYSETGEAIAAPGAETGEAPGVPGAETGEASGAPGAEAGEVPGVPGAETGEAPAPAPEFEGGDDGAEALEGAYQEPVQQA